MEDNLRRDDGVQRDHPFGTDDHLQQGYNRVDTQNNQPQDMGQFKDLLHQGHCEQSRVVTTTGKEGYSVVVHNI